MSKKSEFAHKIPSFLKDILESDKKLSDIWGSLTPIAHNEWICWLTIVKKLETKQEHLRRLREDLLKGKRRPCCWSGCPHRKEKIKQK